MRRDSANLACSPGTGLPPEPVSRGLRKIVAGFTVIAINAARSCGNMETMQALVSGITADCPDWAAIFVSECDSSSRVIDFTNDAHLHLRHMPGKGSRPMQWIVNSKFKACMRSCKWLGRSGALTLGSTCIVGTHNAHGDGLVTSLLQTAALIKQRDWGTTPIVIGDHNIDLLPVCASDPFADLQLRGSKHLEERSLLYAWLQSTGLTVNMPNGCLNAPQGKWHDSCYMAPISRIAGEGSATLPALLDYACDKGGQIKSSWLSWSCAPGDHAALILEIGEPLQARKWAKSHWVVTDADSCRAFMHNHLTTAPTSLTHFHDSLRLAQNMFADRRSCKARSSERFPDQAKTLLEAAHALPQREAAECRQQAWSIVHSRLKAIAIAKISTNIDKGKPPSRATKLWKITTLSINNVPIPSSLDWSAALHDHYHAKWGGKNLTARETIVDYCHCTSGIQLQINASEIESACLGISRRNQLDREGICVNAIRTWCAAQPVTGPAFIAKVMSSNTDSSQQKVHARVFGKSSGDTELTDTRAILPLSSIAQIIDMIVSRRLNTEIDLILKPQPGTYVGARPRTQSCEIAVTVQIWVEKSLDAGSTGAIVQEDVRSHFDTLAMPLILHWLRRHKVDPALIGAAMRCQMMPEVVLQCQGAETSITGRATGGLTGSRVAGALARIPIEQTLSDVAAIAGSLGFDAGPVRLTFASYVDNIFILGKDGASAVLLADKFEEVLASSWQQSIKSSSREIMVPRGALVGAVNLRRWKQVTTMKILGMHVQDNAETNETWEATERLALTTFFRRAHAGLTRFVSTERRVKVANVAIKPLLLFRCAAMPLSETRLYNIEKLQRRLYLSVAGLKQGTSEEKLVWQKRRSSTISNLMTNSGLWHREAAEAHCKFADHIVRSLARLEWPGVMDAWEDTEVAWRRLSGLRLLRRWRGHVAARWRCAAASSHRQDDTASAARRRFF